MNMLHQWHRSSHTNRTEEVIKEEYKQEYKEEYNDEDIPLWDGGEFDTLPVIKARNRKES